MKPGPKPGKKTKVNAAVTIDKDLKEEITKRTENLSGFLNEAGWGHLPKFDKRDRKTKEEKP